MFKIVNGKIICDHCGQEAILYSCQGTRIMCPRTRRSAMFLNIDWDSEKVFYMYADFENKKNKGTKE